MLAGVWASWQLGVLLSLLTLIVVALAAWILLNLFRGEVRRHLLGRRAAAG